MVRRWARWTVRDYGGPSVLMLSPVVGPPGPSVAAVHGPGDHPWQPYLVQGERLWRIIGSGTGHIVHVATHVKYVKGLRMKYYAWRQ